MWRNVLGLGIFSVFRGNGNPYVSKLNFRVLTGERDICLECLHQIKFGQQSERNCFKRPLLHPKESNPFSGASCEYPNVAILRPQTTSLLIGHRSLKWSWHHDVWLSRNEQKDKITFSKSFSRSHRSKSGQLFDRNWSASVPLFDLDFSLKRTGGQPHLLMDVH